MSAPTGVVMDEQPKDPMAPAETGLVKREPTQIITTPTDFRDAVARWNGMGYHVLTPFTNISGMAQQHGIIASVVHMNPDATYAGDHEGAGDLYGGTPYLSKGKGRGTDDEELAIAKLGLRKIAECGAISVKTFRMDPLTIQHYWMYKAVAKYTGIDGAKVEREADQEWDLRHGSERIVGWSERQLREARKNGLRNCEARAINAVIRECGCGIKQKYTRAELRKPFVVIRVAYQPDYNDPDTRRLLTEHALQGTSALYGRVSPAAPQLAEHNTIDAEPVEPRQVNDTPPTTKLDTSTVPEGFGLIHSFDTKQLKKRKDPSQTFTKWVVVDYAGVEHVTIKREYGEALERCFKNKIPVEILSAENDYQENDVTEINPFNPAQPSLPDMKL